MYYLSLFLAKGTQIKQKMCMCLLATEPQIFGLFLFLMDDH